MHPRRFFQRRVHGAVSGDDHDKCDGGQAQAFNPAHADDRRNIERRLMETEKVDDEAIDDADARVQQNTQPMAVKNVGSNAPRVTSIKIRFFPGRSVRSTNQAVGTENRRETITAVAAKPTVFRKVL